MKKDIKKYLCSKHGGEGNPDCPECRENLKKLAEDNNALIIPEDFYKGQKGVKENAERSQR